MSPGRANGQAVFAGIDDRRALGGIGGCRLYLRNALRIIRALKGMDWSHLRGRTIALTPDRQEMAQAVASGVPTTHLDS